MFSGVRVYLYIWAFFVCVSPVGATELGSELYRDLEIKAEFYKGKFPPKEYYLIGIGEGLNLFSAYYSLVNPGYMVERALPHLEDAPLLPSRTDLKGRKLVLMVHLRDPKAFIGQVGSWQRYIRMIYGPQKQVRVLVVYSGQDSPSAFEQLSVLEGIEFLYFDDMTQNFPDLAQTLNSPMSFGALKSDLIREREQFAREKCAYQMISSEP